MTVDYVPTLRALLERTELRLRLASSEDDLEPGALDLPIRWVHSSDLADPTPFLADELVLLTTGTQFLPDAEDGGAKGGAADEAPARDYVARLRARGVRGLGFGTEVVRAGIPPTLLDACRQQRMPLFEVPYRTPFIALARANAEAIAAQAYARRGWALAAQRALSLAALRSDGVGATVAELSRQLGVWGGLFDASGALIREHAAPLDPASATALGVEIDGMLRRGARAGSSMQVEGTAFTLQTLGRGGHLRGALALATADLDHEARGVVTAAVATIGLALEQQEGIERARRALNRGLVQALLAGQSGLVSRVVRESGGSLPSEPIVVAITDVPSARWAASEWLSARGGAQRGALFAGGIDDGVLVVVPATDTSLIEEFTARFDVRAGVSAACRYAGVAGAADQARVARSRGTGAVTRFAELARGGILHALASDDARALAVSAIAALRDHDVRTGGSLEATVRAWLAADCSHEASARALGVHRHTVRSRLALAERLLGRDLGSFAVRAELWTALELAGD